MMAAGSAQVLVVDVVFAGDELQALHRSCIDFDVEIVLAVDGVPGAVHYERALSLSALGVISSSDSGAAVQKLLERLQMRAEVRGRSKGEAERWRVQSEELRRRCKQLAAKFQE